MKCFTTKRFISISVFMSVKAVPWYLRSGDNKPWRDGHKSGICRHLCRFSFLFAANESAMHDGTPCAGKLACTVWSGGKPGDPIKGLPITIWRSVQSSSFDRCRCYAGWFRDHSSPCRHHCVSSSGLSFTEDRTYYSKARPLSSIFGEDVPFLLTSRLFWSWLLDLFEQFT